MNYPSIPLATGVYLDRLAENILGEKRRPGESDESFRDRVLAALPRPPGTLPQVLPQGHKAVPLEMLVELAKLIDPPPVEVDGKVMVFQNPMAAEVLRRVSAVVRELIEYRPPDA